jgi:hypothetical protein
MLVGTETRGIAAPWTSARNDSAGITEAMLPTITACRRQITMGEARAGEERKPSVKRPKIVKMPPHGKPKIAMGSCTPGGVTGLQNMKLPRAQPGSVEVRDQIWPTDQKTPNAQAAIRKSIPPPGRICETK